MSSRLIHVDTNLSISFFLKAEYHSVVFIYHMLFFRSSVSGHLGCFHILPIVNSAATNTGVLISLQEPKNRTSLVVQWLRIRLPRQGTWVWALVQEDPTCRGATKPVRHNYWACALEPASHNYWAHVPQLLKPARLEPMLRNRSHRTATKSSPRSLQLEKARAQQQRPDSAKNK